MVQTIPGCPGSSAEFWGKNYWRYIKGKEVDVGKNLKKLNLTTNVAPHYFYDYCYVFEWIDRYQVDTINKESKISLISLTIPPSLLGRARSFYCKECLTIDYGP